MKRSAWMNLSLLALAGLMFSGVNAWAVGTTGCGLGSMIFKKNSFVSQSFAATTNITGILYSLTTGTSNCKVDSVVQKDKEGVYFVEANFSHLEEEMAAGKGENLAGLARIFNCRDDLVGKMGAMTQSRYEAIFPATGASAYDVYKNVEEQMRLDPALSQGCRVTI